MDFFENFEMDDEPDVEIDDYDEGEGRLECFVCKTPIMIMSKEVYAEYEGYTDTFDFVKWLEETILGAEGICKHCIKAIDKLVEHIDWPKKDYPKLLEAVRKNRRNEIEHYAYR